MTFEGKCVCPDGKYLQRTTNVCVSCDVGYAYNSSTDKCEKVIAAQLIREVGLTNKVYANPSVLALSSILNATKNATLLSPLIITLRHVLIQNSLSLLLGKTFMMERLLRQMF
jgi:hypothetical protein